jgi:hypothetical protein
MKTRETIIDQIKALLSKTTAAGCTEAEELAALDMAAKMRDRHVVTDEELVIAGEEAAIPYDDPSDLTDRHGIKWKLTHGVSEFCGVRIYRNSHWGTRTGLRAFGLPSDVQFAMWLLDHLADFVFTQVTEYLIVDCTPRGERRTAARSFIEGITDRVTERLIELTERSKTLQTGNGRELIVVKDAAVAALMEKLDLRIHTYSGNRSLDVDAAALDAGRAAGDRASFGRPVTDTAGPLRLGNPR